MKERIKWMDVAKTFGIFMVYLCHFTAAGKAYTFSHACSVPLFFFISGCAEYLNTEENTIRYIIKKVKTLLIPAYFFAILSLMIHVIEYNLEYGVVQHTLILVAYGMIRNAYFAQTLWFLTCLFVMQIMFFFVKKLKKKWLIFLASMCLYVIAMYAFPHMGIVAPSKPYNVDSAVYYIIYYAIGYLIFPYINKLFELDTVVKKLVFAITGLGAVYYAIRFFFGVDLYSSIPWPPVAYYFTGILVTCTLIYAWVVVAKLFEGVNGLAEMGKNTLYLCGNEWIVKTLMVHFFAIFGVNIVYYSPLQACIYIGLLLIVIVKFIAPIEKYILNKIVK